MSRTGLALGVLLLATTGCGGSEQPSPRVAGQRLAGWMEQLSQSVSRDGRPTAAWAATDDGAAPVTDGCSRGKERRVYAATVGLPAGSAPEPAERADLLVEQLDQLGWDVAGPRLRGEGGVLSAMRRAEDRTGTKMALVFTAGSRGWRYEITATTACLAR